MMDCVTRFRQVEECRFVDAHLYLYDDAGTEGCVLADNPLVFWTKVAGRSDDGSTRPVGHELYADVALLEVIAARMAIRHNFDREPRSINREVRRRIFFSAMRL